MKLTERETWLCDMAAANLAEELVESIRKESDRPWFILMRIAMLKLAFKLKRARK